MKTLLQEKHSEQFGYIMQRKIAFARQKRRRVNNPSKYGWPELFISIYPTEGPTDTIISLSFEKGALADGFYDVIMKPRNVKLQDYVVEGEAI